MSIRHGLGRLSGQNLAHPLQEPSEASYGLQQSNDDDEHENPVALRHLEAAGEDGELAEEPVEGRAASYCQRSAGEPYAQERLLLEHALYLGQHTRTQRVAERARHQEEQRLREGVVEYVHDAALESQAATEHEEAEAQEDVGEL